MHTTLNKIRAHSPCGMNPREEVLTGFLKLRASLGPGFDPDAPIKITTILDSNGLDDALWCLCAVDGHQREMRLFAVDCARAVQHLMADPRSVAALDVAERHANGEATDGELSAAWSATRSAAWSAAWSAARSAAESAAESAAWSARSAAWSAAIEVQSDLLRIICAEIEQRESA